MADDTDLAFRFRHGWIRLGPSGEDLAPGAPVDEATTRAKRIAARLHRNSPQGKKDAAKRAATVRRALPPTRQETTATSALALEKPSNARIVHEARNPQAAEKAAARAHVRSMSDNSVRDFVEMGEQGKIPGVLAKAAAEEHHRRRHHVPEQREPVPAAADAVKAEKEARSAFNKLRTKHGSDDPRVKKALAKWERLTLLNGGPMRSADADLLAFNRGSHRHPKHDEIKRYEHGLGFSTTEGTDMDLAKPARPRAPRPAMVVHPGGPRPAIRQAKRAFRQSTGVKSLNAPKAQAVLARRAAKPGHFRAKAILAAQSGNKQAAKRLLAKSAKARVARRAPTNSVVVKAPRPAVHPKPKGVPKPRPHGPRRVSLSNVDLAKPGQRFTHGWVPIGFGQAMRGADEVFNDDPFDDVSARRYVEDEHKALLAAKRRKAKRAKAAAKTQKRASLANEQTNVFDLAKPGQRFTHGWVPIGGSMMGSMVDTADFKSQLVPSGSKRKAAKRARKAALAKSARLRTSAERYLKAHPHASTD